MGTSVAPTIERLALVKPASREILSAALLREADAHAPGLPDWLRAYRKANAFHVQRGIRAIQAAEAAGVATFFGTLRAKVIRAGGEELDFGLISTRVVTTAGVNFIVSAFANSVELEVMKYHGIGTDNTAEASADTALGAELSTQYNPNDTRATGSTTTGGSSNIYRTVGTNTVDDAVTITEHGIFSQAATGGGTLLDRSVFSGISLASGDSLQTTYDLTFTAGS